MSEFQVAIGRDVGKVDTDAGGLARYFMKLQVPPGIRNGTEPEISLQYCQGTPNGSLGVGWALGGISAIRKAASNLAFDQFNSPPSSYDRATPKLNLDGAELLLVTGEYFNANAEYTTETDNHGRRITTLGNGYSVTDSTGRRLEYGTTEDSLTLASTDGQPREWRLKRNSDYHGNTITYNYSKSPRSGTLTTLDVNACYLSSIEYTSNSKLGHSARRVVNFEYSSRSDPVLQVAYGEKCLWASLLTAVRFGVIYPAETQITRSYELSYSISDATGDARLSAVTETSFADGKKVSLIPSTFGYTDAGMLVKDKFKTVAGADRVVRLRSIENSVALFPMNTSGRSLADIACIKRDGQRLSIKTYLASPTADGSLRWTPSTGRGAEAALPVMDLAKGFPNILSPDMNNDGRPDFVVPYADSNNRVRFSISQCVGTGFLDYTEKRTDFIWADGSRFMTMEITGRGSSIIQIFAERDKIVFRNFQTFNENNKIGLKDAISTPTSHENKGTIDWIQLTHSSNGAKSLVRIWQQDLGSGLSQLKATPFTIHNSTHYNGRFQEGPTSLLGPPSRFTQTKPTVLSCDVNADGVQDIVLASAEYKADKMELSFTVYLGDGNGKFSRHNDTTTKKLPAVRPLKTSNYGEFHVTNLDGSIYPSLSYVYQAATKTYYCISTNSKSDGMLRDSEIFPLAGDMPADNMQFSPADLNGNGIADWLFYTVENSIPRILPVYNMTNPVDSLSWAQDPMGLRTTITYAPLSDPAVYSTDVKWDNYVNEEKSAYTLLSAPTYVVSRLDHRNVSSLNALDYQASITKSYANARIDTLGRGWQGFREIHTINLADGVLTTERYFQEWPLSNTKKQIDTYSPTKDLVKSVKTAYETASTKQGEWNVFRINTVLEQTEAIDSGVASRINKTQREFDAYGNMTMQFVSETQDGQTMYESYKRCSYTAIDGVTGVITMEKLTPKAGNTDMTRFEEGDISFVVYENDNARAVLRNTLTWSTDVSQYIPKQFDFDDYGRLTRSVDAAGMERTTLYDTFFQTFPIKYIESAPSFSYVELTAFDDFTGMEVANLAPDGSLTCHQLDAFGRTLASRTLAAGPGPETVEADLFLANNKYVADQAMVSVLARSDLNPQRTISFETFKGSGGSAYIGTRIKTYARSQAEGVGETIEYITCARQIRKRSMRNGKAKEATCIWWDFGPRGEEVFESFPTKVSASSELDWQPTDKTAGVRRKFDTLGRQISSMRSAHGTQGRYILSRTSYSKGGAVISEETLRSSDASGNTDGATLMNSIIRRYIHLDYDDYVIETIDENGLSSTFEYDILGRIVSSKDPLGQKQSFVFNSLGGLVSTDNHYQNVSRSSATPAVKYAYNLAGQMIKQTNALGEAITYEPDARGRTIKKFGNDGRTVVYAYEGSNGTGLSSVKVFGPDGEQSAETTFDIDYDYRGRPCEQKLTLADGSTFVTSVEYDWQDRVVQKLLPDGVVVDKVYNGGELISHSLSDGKANTWRLGADTIQYSAFGTPEKMVVNGSGLSEAFTHEWEYDSQGFPSKHTLSSPSTTLVQEHYEYNDMDQISRKHEFLTGETAEYLYSGKRLVSSQLGQNLSRTYAYDAAGNLLEKNSTKLTYSQGQVVGYRNGQTDFEVKYDNAGRTISRKTSNSSLHFTYNSLGAMEKIHNPDLGSVSIVSNAEGEMLQRRFSDGSSDLFLSDDLTIHIRPDGGRDFRHSVMSGSNTYSTEQSIATVTTTFASASSTRSLSSQRTSSVHFSDTKGNVTHIFDGRSTHLKQKFNYDEYGLLAQDHLDQLGEDADATYEGNLYDAFSGLLCFSSRWYDPLVGRFTVPDDIIDVASFLQPGGLNRYVFENNDPINHVDPTGHWSWSSVLGVVIGAALVVAAIAITVATGGAAAPLIAFGVGALAAGGAAGIAYSVKHKDEEDAGKFWAGFGTTVALNAAVGAVTGMLGAVAGPGASIIVRIGLKAAMGGVGSILSTAADRLVENHFYGASYDLFEDAGKTFIGGAVMGGIFAAASGGGAKAGTSAASKGAGAIAPKIAEPFKLSAKVILEPKTANMWSGLGKKLLWQATKMGAKELGKQGGKVGYKIADNEGWKDAALGGLKTGFTKWGEAIGKSGPVGASGYK